LEEFHIISDGVITKLPHSSFIKAKKILSVYRSVAIFLTAEPLAANDHKCMFMPCLKTLAIVI
jgi:hypothetical protein